MNLKKRFLTRKLDDVVRALPEEEKDAAKIEYRCPVKLNGNALTEYQSVESFRSTGLLLFVNQFLHLFGWALVAVFNDEEKISFLYPARVKYRGFHENDVEAATKAVTEYMRHNSNILYKETCGGHNDAKTKA